MVMDRFFIELNRLSTERIKSLADRISDQEMFHPVGEHWTVGVVFAHLAFWDRRVLAVLDKTEQDGKVFIPEVGIIVNDISLPLWLAIPPRIAAQLAIGTAAALDRRLESFNLALVDEIYTYNPRWVDRSRHRNEHLDEAEKALKG